MRNAPNMILMLLVSFVAYGIYQQGFHVGFLYDDENVLQGLSQVSHGKEALTYLFSGDSGPLGRPISMASFLINTPSWPSSPADFLHFNSLLHLINGLLVTWLTLLVVRPRPQDGISQEWLAVFVASAWLLHPAWSFLVLHAVQRMALLATTFVLLGLIGYLKARALMGSRPTLSLLLMVTSLGIGTTLAALSKENGVLLPLFAAALEWLFRQTDRGQAPLASASPVISNIWNHWPLILFWLPALALASQLLQHWPGFNAAAGIRDFTGGERLLTEARVLWQYLANILLPRPLSFTPYYDDFQLSTSLFSPITTIFSLAAWGLAMAFTWFWRKRYPVVAFALAWLLIGHSIESSVVQLELYFEHRNYLPSIGLFMLFGYALSRLPPKVRRLRLAFAVAYLLLLALILHSTISLWNKPLLASEIWLERHPLSVRTIQFRAKHLALSGREREAAEALWAGHLRMPSDTGLAIQGIEAICRFIDPDQFNKIVNDLLPQLESGNFSNMAVTSLSAMITQLDAEYCPSLQGKHLHQIINGLLANPKFKASKATLANLHVLKGQLFLRERNFNATLEHHIEASRLKTSLELIIQISRILASGGLYAEATQTLHDAYSRLPKNPFVRSHWVKSLQEEIAKLEKVRQ